MPDATRQAYRRALTRWVGTMTVAVVTLGMVAVWYAVVAGDVEVLFLVAWYGPLLVLGAFLVISVYYLVLGVLADEQDPDAAEESASPRRPLNP